MTDTTNTTTTTAAPDPLLGQQTGIESSLSSWAGPYVTDMLGKGAALSNMPYASYTGPLTAGANSLQTGAATGIASITPGATVSMGTYSPTSFTDQGIAGQFMSPYIQQALDPQLDEARRQAEITRVNNASRLTKAGAFGGSRQAIMDSEGYRNLGQLLSSITGQGYEKAFGEARSQFNTEEDRKLGAQTENNRFGFNALDAQMDYGNQLRDIESEGITADYDQFKEERDYPYKQVQFLQSLLQGMPLSTQNYSYQQPSAISEGLSSAGGIMEFLDNIFGD
jgi:hypothetical protein